MDRFRLEERIGSGGMGTVYRAFDERLQRYVAVKEVMVGAPERVVREAQAAARLNHPGIVALFEFGVDGHRALLVSELIDGSTLDELAREGALCDRDVAELGADVCEALEHAHARGVVHRDVKPKNVIAREDTGAGRRAKLTDFGIASLAGAPTLTAPGEVVGTLAYMSPEQAEGEQAGPPSDAYSLALTLYECWAGENPARRSTPAQTARDLGGVLPSLGDYRPDLPARLCDAIDACLVAEPDERAPLAELHSALLRRPDLDCDYAVPAPGGHAADERPGLWVPSVSRLAGLALLALACVGARGRRARRARPRRRGPGLPGTDRRDIGGARGPSRRRRAPWRTVRGWRLPRGGRGSGAHPAGALRHGRHRLVLASERQRGARDRAPGGPGRAPAGELGCQHRGGRR